jgi:glycoside/pentoside/hexuronide:cation symporter, GPH family
MLKGEIGWGVKLAYGTGAVASGVKHRAITGFLMLFYNQVVGLNPAVVSAVIMITLLFDALFDPLIGQASDNFRSRWGRRHPFMYAAALPYPLLFFLLWTPPDWSDAALAVYLLVILVGARFFDTFFELPTNALAPELVKGYDERTQIAAIRALFGLAGAVGMTALALNVFMKENADGTGGVLAREGYFNYGLTAALLIFSVIMICSLGTHSQIPRLSRPEERKLGLLQMGREFAQTLNNRSFIAVALGGLFAAAAGGMAQGLELYWNLYLYKLAQSQIVLISVAGIVASVVGAIVSTWFSRWFGKRNAASGLFLTSLICTTAPLGLVLTGLVRDPDVLFRFLLPLQAIGSACNSSALVMLGAMLMDTVEQIQLKTGRRSEGLILAAEQMVKKITSGFGVLVSGLILAVVAFPIGAERHEVPEATLHTMAYYYIPLKAVIMLVCLICLSQYVINREKHQANLQTIRARASIPES